MGVNNESSRLKLEVVGGEIEIVRDGVGVFE